MANTREDRLWQLIHWTLRVTVVLQCLGNWRWLTQIEETPLLHWLLGPADIGGLSWSESTAFATQLTVGWLLLVAAGFVIWRPHAVVLAPLVLLQTLITVAMWRLADGFSVQASWPPPQFLALFPFATQVGRIVAPLGLLLLAPALPKRPDGQLRVAWTMQMLRWAVAIVFLAHGIEAWQQNPKFVDLLINSMQSLFGFGMVQATAERCLSVIGVVDFLLVVACISRRWPIVIGWMTVWGGITALSRVVANGWEMSWHEALTRTPHFGVPLAVVLWWHLLKCRRTTAAAVQDDPGTAKGKSEMPQSSHSNKHLLGFFLLFATGIVGQATPAKADALLEGSNPAQWRLVWTGDPATSAALCWSTAEAGEQHRVFLRPEGSDDGLFIEAQRNGRYSAKKPTLFYHHVRFEELRPATKYHVVLESDGQRSPEMFFVTAPSEDVPLSLLFGADSRSGQEARRQMNAMMAKMLAESQAAERVPILALAHGGDFIFDGRNLEQWSRWMSDHELTVTAEGRLLPIIPARGNHDSGKMFNEVFAFPPLDRNYYRTDIGPQLRLITLNTETSLSGDQLKWLKAELAAARPKKRWLLTQYHRPAFPAVKRSWLNLVHWVPLFEEHNVDLVCEGDGHNIKRTVPIRDYKIDPTGVVYIGEGGLGVGQRTPKAHRWYLNSPQAKTGQGHHVQLLTFDREQLAYRVVMLGGEVFDEHFLPVRTLPTAEESE